MEPLAPTGFWSYTSSDDRNSNGRLSQLRVLVSNALQLEIGQRPEVHIWQDVAAIPHGAEWENEIHKALGQSSFFVPIVTPGFLQSPWCCAEVMRFREREIQLGRSDLIFPLHYINTDDVDPEQRNDCCDPEVLRLLRARQRINFRDLRFRDPSSEDVSIRIAELAHSIRSALRRNKAAGATTGSDRVAGSVETVAAGLTAGDRRISDELAVGRSPHSVQHRNPVFNPRPGDGPPREIIGLSPDQPDGVTKTTPISRLPRSGAIAGSLSGSVGCLILLFGQSFLSGSTLIGIISFIVTGGLFGCAVGLVLLASSKITKRTFAAFPVLSGGGYLAARYGAVLAALYSKSFFDNLGLSAWSWNLAQLAGGAAGGLIGAATIWGGMIACGNRYFFSKKIALQTVVIPCGIGGALLLAADSVPTRLPDRSLVYLLLIHVPWQAYLGFALCRWTNLARHDERLTAALNSSSYGTGMPVRSDADQQSL